MYTTSHCPYCVQAERLLTHKASPTWKRSASICTDRRAEMMHRTGRRSVPQIYIGELHVGGYRELAALERAGELDSLLGGGPNARAANPPDPQVK